MKSAENENISLATTERVNDTLLTLNVQFNGKFENFLRSGLRKFEMSHSNDETTSVFSPPPSSL